MKEDILEELTQDLIGCYIFEGELDGEAWTLNDLYTKVFSEGTISLGAYERAAKYYTALGMWDEYRDDWGNNG